MNYRRIAAKLLSLPKHNDGKTPYAAKWWAYYETRFCEDCGARSSNGYLSVSFPQNDFYIGSLPLLLVHYMTDHNCAPHTIKPKDRFPSRMPQIDWIALEEVIDKYAKISHSST